MANALIWHDPAIEFYTYWWASFLAELLEIWFIVQIAIEVAGVSSWLRRAIVIAIPVLAAIMLAISLALAFSAPMPPYARITYVVREMDLAVSFSVLATFLAGVFLPAESLGLQWSGGVRGIAAGFALEVTTTNYANWLAFTKLDQAVLYQVKSVIYLVTLTIWAASTGIKKSSRDCSQFLPIVEKYAGIYIRALLGAEGKEIPR